MPSTRAAAPPQYLRIKHHILEKIESGEWPASHRVPSEHEIVRQFGISRMTANRALRELQDAGAIVRHAGVGSFVAPRQAGTHPLEIHNIADEIRARGHEHTARVLALRRVRAGARLAQEFRVPPGQALFFSSIVHSEDGRPLLLEERHVLPEVGPQYLEVDFTRQTPNEYLMRVAPLQQAEHVLRAVVPGERVRGLLRMKPGEPCLALLRRTWSEGRVASVAQLHYPGSRYEMVARFQPPARGVEKAV